MVVEVLIIEDGTLTAMMLDPRIMALLPCLAGPKKQLAGIAPGGGSCKRCAAAKKQIAADAMRTAKACLLSTRDQRLVTLKQLLQATQLRIHTRNATGHPVTHTL